MKHCFIITSAINTKFGVYNANDRLLQTIITIRSIRQKVPDAKIVLIEMAALPLTEQQTKNLTAETDLLLDFTDEEDVKKLYNSTDNWDIVKNCTEIMVFGAALKMMREDNDFENIDRIHKISGRYVINDAFDVAMYAKEEVASKIVVAERRATQFPLHITDQREQYMSRLWSWPAQLCGEIINFYDAALADFTDTIGRGQYIDIEHLLCKLLPQEHILEVKQIGIEGMIGPNGQAVKD